ncbi:MAG: IS1595 family transposase [Pseudomonadota bacterium]
MAFTELRFTDETAARKHLEAQRWPNGPVCPHCGGLERNSRLEGKAHRPGLWNCGDCRTQFSVTVGTVFERSKIPLHKWVLATHLLCASKKGMSSHQLHRMLDVTYKTAWFMTHRIREAFKTEIGSGPIGGGGKIVEADETYYGNARPIKRVPGRRVGGAAHKHKIFSLVERDGAVRSFLVANVTAKTLKPILDANVAPDTHLMTDNAGQYRGDIRGQFLSHETVNHRVGQYAKKSRTVKGAVAHSNTVESFFGLLKRGLVGTYHHVSEQHLQKYCTEFDFRFTHRKATDDQRAASALAQIGGKRLTYRRIGTGAQA